MSRLLLVDDNDSLRVSLCAVLEDEGYAVETAASFDAARSRLDSGAPRFAAALLDVHLGDALGTDLIPLFRDASPDTKLVVLTGSDAVFQPSEGADACFEKGGDIDDLLAALRVLLPRPAHLPEGARS